MPSVDEELRKLRHTLDALREHARLQGSELTSLVFPTLNGDFLVSMTFYPDAKEPRCRVSVDVEGSDRNDIISKLKTKLELVRSRFAVLLGPHA